jgi:capsular polysaccharide biosynthesis protein
MTNFKQTNNTSRREAKEINLKEILNVIMKRFLIIIIMTCIAGIAGFYYSSYNQTPLYQTSSRIIIGANGDLMKTLQVIIKDTTVLEKVIQELDLAKSPEALAGQINVQSVEASQVVSINVVDTDPVIAAEIANTTAKVFKEEVPNIIEFNDVRNLSEAKVNPYPINGNQDRTILIAIIIGLVAGVGIAFLLDSFDDTIRSEREIEELLGIPVIGHVSKMNKKNIKKKGHYEIELNLRGETNVSK